MKKKLYRLAFAAAMTLSVGVFGSCSDLEDDTDYDTIEQDILDLWMAENREVLAANYSYTDICDNRMGEGYYVQIVTDKSSDEAAGAAAEPGGWVKYEITSTDLDGNICNNRSETMAVQQGTFNYYAHYVPFTDYIPDQYDGDEADADEAIEYLLQSDALQLYVNGTLQDVKFRAGSEFVIYMTSDIGGQVNGLGGYAGQFSLLGYRPMISTIKITEVMDTDYEGGVMNYEKNLVDEFKARNSSIGTWTWLDDDSVDYIYVCEDYDPIGEGHRLEFGDDFYPYSKLLRDREDEGISSVQDLNNEFYEVLKNDEYNSFDEVPDDDVVSDDGTAYIWYIVRTLDGFIVDTNIADVQESIYRTTTTNISSLQYDASVNESDYISAWYFVIPKLKYGTWNAFVTTSGNAYGSSGVSPSSSSSEIPPYTPLLFEIFIQAV